DHFATFPVLPGVMMLEAMVQAGRRLVESVDPPPRAGGGMPLVLGKVRALKYGRFVKPGDSLRVEVTLGKSENGEYDMRGEGRVIEPGGAAGESAPVAVSGRFVLRAARV